MKYSIKSQWGTRGLPVGYFLTRFAVLRAPLGRELGTERLADDDVAVHVWIEDSHGLVVSVGRAHYSQLDKAVQVRMMATRPEHHRQGLGRLVLTALGSAVGVRWPGATLWLNARENAVIFYTACGWRTMGDDFNVPGIGLHTRMTRRLP